MSCDKKQLSSIVDPYALYAADQVTYNACKLSTLKAHRYLNLNPRPPHTTHIPFDSFTNNRQTVFLRTWHTRWNKWLTSWLDLVTCSLMLTLGYAQVDSFRPWTVQCQVLPTGQYYTSDAICWIISTPIHSHIFSLKCIN